MKYWKVILIGLGIIPFFFIITLLTFYFHTGIIIGRLPQYSFPDPKQLSIYNKYSVLINATWVIWVVSFFIWIMIVLLYLVINRKNISWRLLGYSATGQIMAMLLLCSKIMEWYRD